MNANIASESWSQQNLSILPGQVVSATLSLGAGSVVGDLEFVVVASDSDGAKPAHANVSTNGILQVVDPTVMIPPSNLSANYKWKQNEVALSWSAASGGLGLQYYAIYRDGVQIGTSPTTAFNDQNVVVGSTYIYEVSAIDIEDGESDKSNSVSITASGKGGGKDGGGGSGGKGNGKGRNK